MMTSKPVRTGTHGFDLFVGDEKEVLIMHMPIGASWMYAVYVCKRIPDNGLNDGEINGRKKGTRGPIESNPAGVFGWYKQALDAAKELLYEGGDHES